jgi:transcriptional regulator with XRE-family HTH domain
MDISERLKAVIKQSSLGREEFAEKTGVSRRHLFNYLGGKSSPTSDFFQAVKKAFPWVNIEWLITGIGEMESPHIGEEASPYSKTAPPVDAISEKILLMLREMPDEKRREVLKYTEDQKLIAEFLAEKGRGRKANGEPD